MIGETVQSADIKSSSNIGKKMSIRVSGDTLNLSGLRVSRNSQGRAA